ncbi:hypothetical protein BH09ACT9_BH09ACT9_00410 [soil metagenome]
MIEFLQAQIVKLYTRHCDGHCGDDTPHDAHLTALGRKHYLGRFSKGQNDE